VHRRDSRPSPGRQHEHPRTHAGECPMVDQAEFRRFD
jgi:hypothetical protein